MSWVKIKKIQHPQTMKWISVILGWPTKTPLVTGSLSLMIVDQKCPWLYVCRVPCTPMKQTIIIRNLTILRFYRILTSYCYHICFTGVNWCNSCFVTVVCLSKFRMICRFCCFVVLLLYFYFDDMKCKYLS
jgi:hypothetical protein